MKKKEIKGTMFHLLHKAVTVLVLCKISLNVLQTFQHISQAAPHPNIDISETIESAVFGSGQCRTGADSDFEVLRRLSGTANRCEYHRLKHQQQPTNCPLSRTTRVSQCQKTNIHSLTHPAFVVIVIIQHLSLTLLIKDVVSGL